MQTHGFLHFDNPGGGPAANPRDVMRKKLIENNMDFSIIFDMDGVIVNNNPYHKKAWKLFCKKHNLSLTDQELESKIYGRTGDEVLSYLFNKELKLEIIEQYSTEINKNYRELFAPHIKPIIGLKEFLDDLNQENIKYAIATSAPPINVNFVLSKTRLTEYFQIIVDDTQITKSKPSPEIYLKTANRLNVEPGVCIVIEDSISGIDAALNAGMKVVGITTTHNSEELKHTDLIINNFLELSVSRLRQVFKA